MPYPISLFCNSVHRHFNKLAKKFGVFVVEATGDAFVFIAGIGAEPRPDHALVIVQFARKCTKSLRRLTQELESTLGPDTADLELQIGIASGPVTGGTLRGDKSRYQVFGTTMKTANLLVATGSCGMIHVSQETADRLSRDKQEMWLTARPDRIGHLSTYWLSLVDERQHRDDMSTISFEMSENWGDAALDDEDSQRLGRLISWNVGQLESVLKKVVYVTPTFTCFVASLLTLLSHFQCPTSSGISIKPKKSETHSEHIEARNQRFVRSV